MNSVSHALRNLRNLRVLRKKCPFLEPRPVGFYPSCSHIDSSLSALKNLTKVDLDCREWGCKGAKALAEPLRCFSLLQKLSLFVLQDGASMGVVSLAVNFSFRIAKAEDA